MGSLPLANSHAGPRESPLVLKLPLFRLTVLALSTLLAIVMLLVADGSSSARSSPELAQTLLAVAEVGCVLVTAAAATSGRRKFALMMLSLYFAVFLILPGYHHLSINTFPFFGMHYDYATRTDAAVMIALFLVCAFAGYLAGERFALARPAAPAAQLASVIGRLRVEGSVGVVALLTAAAFVSLAALVLAIGPSQVFVTRGAAAAGDAADVGIGAGLIAAIAKALTAASLVYSYIMYGFGRRELATRLALLANLIIYNLVNWPPAQARFGLFGSLLLLLMLTFDFRTIRSRAAIAIGFLGGAFVAMPMWDALTRGRAKGTTFNLGETFDRFFQSGDFDGLQSLQNAVMYVSDKGFENGRQILGTLFFFVPRSIWHGKAEPTGVLGARHAGFSFTNISMPLPGELYVDFGMFGMGICAIALGALLGRLDVWIERNWWYTIQSRVAAALIVGFSVIVYRGSLLGIISGISVLAAVILLTVRVGFRRPNPALRLLVQHRP